MQIAHAVRRKNVVAVQHRTTAFLASLFDVLFAHHRAWHPGEKRLLDHAGVRPGVDRELLARVRAFVDAPVLEREALTRELAASLARIVA